MDVHLSFHPHDAEVYHGGDGDEIQKGRHDTVWLVGHVSGVSDLVLGVLVALHHQLIVILLGLQVGLAEICQLQSSGLLGLVLDEERQLVGLVRIGGDGGCFRNYGLWNRLLMSEIL